MIEWEFWLPTVSVVPTRAGGLIVAHLGDDEPYSWEEHQMYYDIMARSPEAIGASLIVDYEGHRD